MFAQFFEISLKDFHNDSQIEVGLQEIYVVQNIFRKINQSQFRTITIYFLIWRREKEIYPAKKSKYIFLPTVHVFHHSHFIYFTIFTIYLSYISPYFCYIFHHISFTFFTIFLSWNLNAFSPHSAHHISFSAPVLTDATAILYAISLKALALLNMHYWPPLIYHSIDVKSTPI